MAPVLLVSHGAATLTTCRGDPLDAALRGAGAGLAGARAIVVVSAHDVRDAITVGVAPVIAMWNDHPAAAGLSWEAPGAFDVAERLAEALANAGLTPRSGAPLLDHGAWVPLRALDPTGLRPIVTLSLDASLDPLLHLRLGAALRTLREIGVAIVASGGLTHNQAEFRRGFFAGDDVDRAVAPSSRFAEWALATLATGGPARTGALLKAVRHSDFSFCHPSLDHWLPTLVAVGAVRGDEAGVVLHRGYQHSLSTAMVRFGLD